MTPAALEKWLRRRPRESLGLQLTATEDLSGLVQEWSSAEIAQMDPNAEAGEPSLRSALELARAIVSAADDHAELQGEPCRLVLRWLMPEGERGPQTVIKAKPPKEPTEELNMDGSADVGDMRGIATQGIRHLNNMHRMYALSLGGVLQNQRELIADLRTQLADMQAENKSLRQRVKRTDEPSAETDGELLEREATANAIEKVGNAIASEVIPGVMRAISGAGETKQ